MGGGASKAKEAEAQRQHEARMMEQKLAIAQLQAGNTQPVVGTAATAGLVDAEKVKATASAQENMRLRLHELEINNGVIRGKIDRLTNDVARYNSAGDFHMAETKHRMVMQARKELQVNCNAMNNISQALYDSEEIKQNAELKQMLILPPIPYDVDKLIEQAAKSRAEQNMAKNKLADSVADPGGPSAEQVRADMAAHAAAGVTPYA